MSFLFLIPNRGMAYCNTGSGAKVCVSNSKESPVLICAYGLAHWDTAWTLFAQNTAKVYSSSGIPPRVPGWRQQKSSAVREISPRIRMRCRKIVPRPGFSPEMRTAQLIHSVRAFSLETWPRGTKQCRRAFSFRSPALLWIDGGRFCHRWCLPTI